MRTCISTLCSMKNNLPIYAFLNDTGVLKFALSACVSVRCANKLVKTVFQFAIVVYSMSSFDGKCKAVHHGSTAVFCTFQQSDYACVLSPVYWISSFNFFLVVVVVPTEVDNRSSRFDRCSRSEQHGEGRTAEARGPHPSSSLLLSRRVSVLNRSISQVLLV